MSPAPSYLSADAAAVHIYHDVVFIILFARKYSIPKLLKRTFHELLASAEFWIALTADRNSVGAKRSREWRVDVPGGWMMLESEVVEAGMGDPLRYDTSSGLTKEQKEACETGQWEWWASFGDFMQLA
ncbi:uncharacterized protein TRAVEDRAFT_52760 [Trametes versicolor FP-101664 SS1]|uniref:uncharacterized protein n=1 Tax=Trametes versicolor (strain FP-101664) TaxID=717944 RepID=UPI00046224C5|nr:uncharacterized protein TRAVEDRAFT_52760 [Trametes versicolor FP-101664 SS1]EIW53640.1 hypothetical protein TRAVEDRAFT_52760 [Trametes versicolor FP-101664 SS1]